MHFYNSNHFNVKRFKTNPKDITFDIFDFLKNEKKINFNAHFEFMSLISERTKQFEDAYNTAPNKIKKLEVIKQYNHFYQTLENCLNNDPKKINSYVKKYQDPRHYEPIGCNNYHRPGTKEKIASGATIGLGVAGIIGGIIAFPFCLPLALGLIVASSIAIITTALCLYGSYYLDDKDFKEDEKLLFEEGAEIVNELAINKEACNDESIEERCDLRMRKVY